jgi:hypothetical protein
MPAAAHPGHFDRETRNAFNELLLMDQLSKLPVSGLLRVLQTIPAPVLEAAVSAVSRSPCRDGSGWQDRSPPPGFR